MSQQSDSSVPSPQGLSRRSLLRGSAGAALAGGLATTLPRPAAAQDAEATAQPTVAGEDWVRVYLVVIDGLRPDEVAQMPTLSRLGTEGYYYPHSRAQMLAETTPNHVSMITGMRVDRHGMPGNSVAYLDDNIGENPRYLQTDTLYSLIARQAPDLVATAATAKSYIVNMTMHSRVDEGTEDADATNDPFIVPISGSAVDAEVGPDALEQSRTLDPDLLWMSLGDVDRVGHIDENGATGGPPAARSLALETADRQVANLVQELEDSGRWANTVMLVTADHSMDWSTPDSVVNLTEQFEADESLAGRTAVAQNGGAALYWLLAPSAPDAGQRLRTMREIALATGGVAEAWYTAPNPVDGDKEFWVGATRPDWGLAGDRTGDLVVIAEDGFRITEPQRSSNPIPGNHGHIVTLPIPQIISGGWDGVLANDATPELSIIDADGLPIVGGVSDLAAAQGDAESPAPDVRLPDQGENIDLAPTMAWLLGINPPPGGFDGRVLQEAFSRMPEPRVGVADVPSVPRYRQLGGATRFDTAVLLSNAAFGEPDGVNAVVLASGEDFPDALAATPLAAAAGGPLLLTQADRLTATTREELARLRPSRVLIVGGESAVSAAVADEVEQTGASVTRVEGPNRFATAAAIARQIIDMTAAEEESSFSQTDGGPEVILASGAVFADALVAGPLAGSTAASSC